MDKVQQEEEVLAPFTQPEKNRKKRKRNSSIWKEFNEEEDAFVCKIVTNGTTNQTPLQHFKGTSKNIRSWVLGQKILHQLEIFF